MSPALTIDERGVNFEPSRLVTRPILLSLSDGVKLRADLSCALLSLLKERGAGEVNFGPTCHHSGHAAVYQHESHFIVQELSACGQRGQRVRQREV